MAADCIARIARLRERVSAARREDLSVGCVPTMGALHRAHLELIDRARAECGLVVVTIFVNPLQFDREDDLRSYPRTLERDVELCDRHGADVVFAPSVDEMYPREPVATVKIRGLADGLCGASRPGHFSGVATVVLKLLNAVQPDVAYFGEKDYQQLVIIRALVEDSCLPVRIRAVETVREADGLALSSRNALLTDEQRAAAPALARELRNAARAVRAGESDAAKILGRARRALEAQPLLRLDYFDIVDPSTLRPVPEITGPVRIAAAAFLGTTRLIDNLPASPKVA